LSFFAFGMSEAATPKSVVGIVPIDLTVMSPFCGRKLSGLVFLFVVPPMMHWSLSGVDGVFVLLRGFSGEPKKVGTQARSISQVEAAMSGKSVFGESSVNIEKCNKCPFQDTDAFCVFFVVGNIPFDVTEEMLLPIFEQAGPVVNLRIVRDKATNKPK